LHRVAAEVTRFFHSALRVPNSAFEMSLVTPAITETSDSNILIPKFRPGFDEIAHELDTRPLSRLAKYPIRVHSFIMQLTLLEAVETKLSTSKAPLHLTIGLFVSEEAALGQAAEIAGLTQAAFQKELGQRHIPIHYGMAELAEDLRAVESFRRS
jgi:predicted HTH domain antitoxin